MKLKIGELVIERKPLLKWAVLLLVQGVLVGLMVAAKQDGHSVSPAMFIMANVILIPALARQLLKR